MGREFDILNLPRVGSLTQLPQLTSFNCLWVGTVQIVNVPVLIQCVIVVVCCKNITANFSFSLLACICALVPKI